MNLGKILLIGIFLGAVAFTVYRVSVFSSEQLYGGPYVDKFEKRGKEYSLQIKPEFPLSNIISIGIFEGFTPSSSSFDEKLQNKPVKFVKISNHHHYNEYIMENGRLQFHSGFFDGDISYWLEFIPTDLSIDSFFSGDIAVNFNPEQPEFRVTIEIRKRHMLMAIKIKNKKVDKVVWVNFFFPP